MVRFDRSFCALAMCGAVTTAFGAAVKIHRFDTSFGVLPSGADGMAVLNYVSGEDETIVQIVVMGFIPTTNYTFTLDSPNHCLSPGGGLVTDENGNATVHFTMQGGIATPDCPVFEDGDYSDADIVFRQGDDLGPVAAVARNPS